jgi:uncharacterized protein (TIGR02302 family)
MTDRTLPVSLFLMKEVFPRSERLIRFGRLVMVMESLLPRLIILAGVAGVFVAVSWLGLWQIVPHFWHQAGLLAFALAGLAICVWLLFLKHPEKRAIVARLEKQAGLRHHPLAALEDAPVSLSPASLTQSPERDSFWRVHQERARLEIEALQPLKPLPVLVERDPFALRLGVLLLLVTTGFVAGPERKDRLYRAFTPSLPKSETLWRLDGWIDPPSYTRQPPVRLNITTGTGAEPEILRVPVRSLVVIRLAGEGTLTVTPAKGLEAVPASLSGVKNIHAQTTIRTREQRFAITQDAELIVTPPQGKSRIFHFKAIPDTPPTIAWAQMPSGNLRGHLTFSYHARDDYGLIAITPLITHPEADRALVPAPKTILALPSSPTSETAPPLKGTLELAAHPWAGAKVDLVLEAHDDAGQRAHTSRVSLVLPQRQFLQPLAKALIEQRRKLVLFPDERGKILTALEALLIAPDVFTPHPGEFLGLKIAADSLREAANDDDLRRVADWLWAMATEIEDGPLSDAQKALRAAQERLKDAIERGESEEDIRRLTQEMREAMNRYMQELNAQARRNPSNEKSSAPERTVTQNDLDRLLQQIEELMRQGDKEGAQKLLEALQNLLENLQMAQNGHGQSGENSQQNSSSLSRDLEALTREQNRLRDDTYRQERRTNDAEGNSQDNQQNSPSLDKLRQRQSTLRERLRSAQDQAREQGLSPESGLNEAESAMREAEEALREGRTADSAEAQGRAVENLRQGRQALARNQREAQQQETQDAGGSAQNHDEPATEPGPANDPLGRPVGRRPLDGGVLRIPGTTDSAPQRSRRILEDLRRRLEDPYRPRPERDYLERLLDLRP